MLILCLSWTAIAGSADVRYLHLDVFTDRPLSGNQLAVFLEPGSLSAEQMLAITREMAFSETTFVFAAEDDETAFRVRIFANNLGREIQVAGHPTIGTVFALAHEGLIDPGTDQSSRYYEAADARLALKCACKNRPVCERGSRAI